VPDIFSPAIPGSRLALSSLAPETFQSEIRAMTTECDRIGGINLAQGVCDTPVPEVVEAAAIQAIRDGQNIYTRCDGIARLREAIAAKQIRDYGLNYSAENEVLVASGATAGLHAAAMALLNPGDEVLVFEPFTATTSIPQVAARRAHPGCAGRAGVAARCRRHAGRGHAAHASDPAEHARQPHRKIFSLPELEAVAQLCLERDLFLITDEIYEYFVYDSARHICPATLPGMRERTIVISGFSKTFSITGWRVGYAAADVRWMPAMAHFHDLTYVCAPAPFQVGTAAGLEQLPPSFYTQLALDHQSKRARLLAALNDAGMEPHVPPGAYYIMASADRLPGKTAAEKARHLLRTTGVAAVAGSAFFRPGRGENCCASALPSGTRSWTRLAPGCASSEESW
jgi:aminotransferase